MTLEELNKEITEMEEKLKELKEQKRLITRKDLLRQERREFHDMVMKLYPKVTTNGKKELSAMFIGEDYIVFYEKGFYRYVWAKILQQAIMDLKGCKVPVMSLSDEEIEKLKLIISVCCSAVYNEMKKRKKPE